MPMAIAGAVGAAAFYSATAVSFSLLTAAAVFAGSAALGEIEDVQPPEDREP